MLKVAVSCLVLVAMIDGSTLKFHPRDKDVISKNQMEDTPAFCNKLDCPRYSLVKKTKDYEVRKYVPTHWFSTNLAGADYRSASFTLFMRLFRYIQGNNVKKEKIEMTTPVLMRITPGQGPTCANNFTMSFFNSPKVPHAPGPKDPTVFLSSMPTMTVYVATYGGFSTESVFLEKAAALQTALESDKMPFVKDHYFTAGYNSPFQLLHRHNEIWFLAK